jgi:hypothetical protein
MDERLNRIIDYFEAWDLVQLLGLSTGDIVSSFPDDIEDKLEALEDIMEIYE